MPSQRTFGQGHSLILPDRIALDVKQIHCRWRAVNAPHLVALVRTGAVFEKGKHMERPVDSSTTKAAA